jgi:hypothetical protein
LAQVFGAGGPPDLERVARVAERFGLEIDPASVPRLVETHGLVPA